jgi:hypothetical protein
VTALCAMMGSNEDMGHADMAVAGLRTVLRPSARTCRVRGCDRGLDADTDCP